MSWCILSLCIPLSKTILKMCKSGLTSYAQSVIGNACDGTSFLGMLENCLNIFNWCVLRCRRNGFTIQGALCAAQMLSCAKARESDHPLPQKISYLAPVDMRQRVNKNFANFFEASILKS